MKFDINNYKGRYVMHCKTKAEVEEFCDYLRQHNIYHNASSVYNMYNGSTCFNFNSDTHDSEKFYKENGYIILEWSDFTNEFTKADLKDGMVVEYANGWRRMVLNGNLLGVISGHNSLTDIFDDLKSKWSQNLDINKVYTCDTGHLSGISRVFTASQPAAIVRILRTLVRFSCGCTM